MAEGKHTVLNEEHILEILIKTSMQNHAFPRPTAQSSCTSTWGSFDKCTLNLTFQVTLL